MAGVPQEIRVVGSAASAWTSAKDLLERGARPAEVGLAAYADCTSFTEDLVRVFEIPYPMGGVDGAIDWLSDFEWLEHRGGHVVVFDDWDGAHPDVAEAVVVIATSALDRWRTADPEQPYVIFIVSRQRQAELIRLLKQRNDELDAFGRQRPTSDTHAVPVVVVD